MPALVLVGNWKTYHARNKKHSAYNMLVVTTFAQHLAWSIAPPSTLHPQLTRLTPHHSPLPHPTQLHTHVSANFNHLKFTKYIMFFTVQCLEMFYCLHDFSCFISYIHVFNHLTTFYEQ